MIKPELIEAIDSLPAGANLYSGPADLKLIQGFWKANITTDDLKELVTEITSLRNQLSVAKEALERIEKGEDYHGSSLGARSIAREALSAMKSEEEKQDAL